ncbi:MAG: CopD family protein [Nitrospiraceae bacterium]|nr:CopD family protein [Nitrospiraceae bacterium]
MFIHSFPAWLELSALALSIGLLMCRLWVFPPAEESSYQRDSFSRMGRFLCISIAVLFAASLMDLLVRAADMSGRPVDEACEVLPVVLFKTHYGRVWFLRISALLVISIALMAGRRHRDSRGLSAFILAAFVVIAMTESASGHAADAGDFSMAETMDLLHLLAASVWGGGLFALTLSVLPGIGRMSDDNAPILSVVAGRFSSMAGIAVAVVTLTALYNARQYVGGVKGLIATPYGWIVIAKIIIFFILLQLGGFNRYINVPLLQRWAGPAPVRHQGPLGPVAIRLFEKLRGMQEGRVVAQRFRRSVQAEAFLILAALLCAALLRHEIPARHHSHLGHVSGKTHSMQPMSDDDQHTQPEHHNHDAGK